MENGDNEMERLYAETFQTIEEGAVLRGTVISIKSDGVVVDIGYKSEGFIGIDEFERGEIDGLRPGDMLEVFVVNMRGPEGVVRLSRERAANIRTWEVLQKALESGTPVEGVITGETKGGLTVELSGVKAFLPGSQADVGPVKNMSELMGTRSMFRVLKINSRRSNVIVSRRALMEEELQEKKRALLENMRDGAIISGTVKNITDYGAFVDLGGMDGLLHISDMSWRRISHPSQLFSVGDVINVIVLKYDKANEKVALGYRQITPDPWSGITDKYPPGARVAGKVVGIMDYGVFLELPDGLEGLVHISELDWASKPKHPGKYVGKGETVEAVVVKVDPSERKMSLSIKRLQPSPWETAGSRYCAGMKISGKVKSITEFGAFIGMPEGVDGLVHISDMTWTRHISHPSEILKKGQTVDALVLSIDAARGRMSLGIKQLTPDPWLNDIPNAFKSGDVVSGIVLRITDFGIFVELDGGAEGLIYASEAGRQDAIGIGSKVSAKIIKMDVEERKIGLSLKNIGKDSL